MAEGVEFLEKYAGFDHLEAAIGGEGGMSPRPPLWYGNGMQENTRTLDRLVEPVVRTLTPEVPTSSG
jgi:hypothetical protein